MSASGRPDLVVTGYGALVPPGRQVYELRFGCRVFSREVTDRERVAEESDGFWQEAGRLERDAQVLRARADETTPGLGKVRRGDVEPQIEEEAWEKERALFVALFPDAEPFLLPASRVERERVEGWDLAARVAQSQIISAPHIVTREMVEGPMPTRCIPDETSLMDCALCGAVIPTHSLDGVDRVERHREWHDLLVRTREIPVRH